MTKKKKWKGKRLNPCKHLQERGQGWKGEACGLQGNLEMKLYYLLSGVFLAYCCVASISILWLRLGSVGGKQSGSLFCWASALKDPAASNASAICSVSPLTPVTPTLGPPGVLAGGGAVGPSVFLIWEGIWRTRKWNHLYNTCHSVYRPEISYIRTGPATRACKCNCILRSRVWRENNCFLNQHEIINKCINAFLLHFNNQRTDFSFKILD